MKNILSCRIVKPAANNLDCSRLFEFSSLIYSTFRIEKDLK
jgi:hypothetical protein